MEIGFHTECDRQQHRCTHQLKLVAGVAAEGQAHVSVASSHAGADHGQLDHAPLLAGRQRVVPVRA
jgi:hypothetical protein